MAFALLQVVVGKLGYPVVVEVEIVQPLVDFGVAVDFVVVVVAAAAAAAAAAVVTNAKQCE